MLHHLSIDIETYSPEDLKKTGLYRYAMHPDFAVLLLAYSMNRQPVQVVDLAQGERLPAWLPEALQDPNVLRHAYNAAFEWFCLNRAGLVTPLQQWRCTMMHGLYCGYTIGLGPTGEAMGIPQDRRKLSTGKSLITTFCKPCKPAKSNGMRTRTLPHHEPEKWQLFKTYCAQDVVAEMDILRRLSAFPVPESEQRLWELDCLMNAHGVAVDGELVASALHCSSVTTFDLMEEARALSGLDNPNSGPQLKKWLEDALEDKEDQEIDLPDVTKATVKTLLGRVTDDNIRRMLEIRQELAKTSVKKYAAMQAAVCADGRVRGLLQHYGANRTGRWAGRLVQVQNLPQNHLEPLEAARRYVCARDLEAVRLVYGNVPNTLSQLIRTALVPSPGCEFLVADYSAIEARVIAWLAMEQWRMDVFATHGKIYEASASQMFGVPIDEIKKGSPLRQKGKVAELALGYQGGPGALIKMGALDQGLTEEELPDIVRRWREANRRIVGLWAMLERGAVAAVKEGIPAQVNRCIIFARESDQATGQDFMTIQLPSGRKLFYARPKVEKGEYDRDQLSYWGMDQSTKKWSQMPTYGGRLVENCVQAIARDCLAEAMQRVVAAGYRVVFHVHDELVIEAPVGTQLEPVLELMGQPVPWAQGLLLRADGYKCEFYRKD